MCILYLSVSLRSGVPFDLLHHSFKFCYDCKSRRNFGCTKCCIGNRHVSVESAEKGREFGGNGQE